MATKLQEKFDGERATQKGRAIAAEPDEKQLRVVSTVGVIEETPVRVRARVS